jgi:hypothetical protein
MREAWRSGRFVTPVAIAFGLTVAATGCGSQRAENDPSNPPTLEQLAAEARADGYEWQAGVLEDGDVTLAEFDEGSRRNLECITQMGMSHSEPERVLTDGYSWYYEINYETVDPEEASDLVAECSQENEMYLQLAMSAWGDWRTDAALLADVENCVRDAGFDVRAGARNYREVWLNAADQGLTTDKVTQCVDDGMYRLYPGKPSSIGFW